VWDLHFVKVGCLARHVVGFLGSVVGALHRRHPDVQVVIDELELEGPHVTAEVFSEALTSGMVDVLFGPRLLEVYSIPGTTARSCVLCRPVTLGAAPR
jgi:hypothetical protein